MPLGTKGEMLGVDGRKEGVEDCVVPTFLSSLARSCECSLDCDFAQNVLVVYFVYLSWRAWAMSHMERREASLIGEGVSGRMLSEREGLKILR